MAVVRKYSFAIKISFINGRWLKLYSLQLRVIAKISFKITPAKSLILI